MQIIGADRYKRNGLGANRSTIALIMSLVLFAACEGPSDPIAAETAVAESIAPESYELACGEDGRLSVELYGSIRASIEWLADELNCAGMPRPDGEGARVRMSGSIGSSGEIRTLAFILGLPSLSEGQTGTELPTNVTLIEEGTGHFFGTRDASGCWTDVTRHESISGRSDRLYRIEGTLYCVSPLAELNGSTSVSFTELNFAGRLNWGPAE